MGFGAEVKSREERSVGELLAMVEPEDLLKFGMIPEFIGRLPVVATLNDLDEQALVRILRQPKNALIKQYQKFFELERVRLKFTDDAVAAVAREAMKRGTGARGLRAVLEEVMLEVMYELPSIPGPEGVHHHAGGHPLSRAPDSDSGAERAVGVVSSREGSRGAGPGRARLLSTAFAASPPRPRPPAALAAENYAEALSAAGFGF